MQTLTFEQKVSLTLCVFFESQTDAACETSCFLRAACDLGCFTHHELLELESALCAPSGKLPGTSARVEKGQLHGIQVKQRPARVQEVNEQNMDSVYKRYIRSEHVAAIARSRVEELYATLLTLRNERNRLHRELSEMTFRVLSEDAERYDQAKKRAQVIQKARRQARKCERAAQGPKPKRVPKRPRKPKKEEALLRPPLLRV